MISVEREGYCKISNGINYNPKGSHGWFEKTRKTKQTWSSTTRKERVNFIVNPPK